MNISGLTLFIVVFSQLAACSFTAPAGTRELSAIVKNSRYQNVRDNVHLGRPIFVKVRAFQSIESGDIREAHTLHLQVGRENLSVSDLVGVNDAK